MIYNNLNRIKGILSARLGAEIPKFDVGGPTVQKSYSWNGVPVTEEEFKALKAKSDAEIRQFREKTELGRKLNIRRLQSDPVSITVDNPVVDNTVLNNTVENNTTPTTVNNAPAELNKLLDDGPVETVLRTEIPGALQATPYTAAENAAKHNEISRQKVDEMIAERRAAAITLPDVNVTATNPNATSTVSTLNVQPVNQTLSPEEISAGIRTVQEKLKKVDDAKILQRSQNWQSAGQALGAGILAIGGAMGAQQATSDSNTTKNITAAWDGAANIASQFGPIGEAVGAVMGIAKGAGDIIQGITGGTDLITKTDQWMSSPLLSWNVGIVNDLFAKKTEAFGMDTSAVEAVGSSYGGSVSQISDAAKKADKKVGLLAGKERRQINADIANARASQARMRGVADTATDQRLAVQSMGEQAGLAYSMMTDGGYNLKYTYAAKHGGLLEWNPVAELEWEPQVELNWELPTFKEGGSVEFVEELEWIPEFKDGNKLDFDTWFNSIPEEYRASGYDYKKAYEVFDWDLLSKHAKDPKNNHLGSVSPVADENGNFPFLKLGKLDENKELQGEFNWYNSEEGKEHRNKFDIKFIDGRYHYVPKQLKQGGSVGDSDVPEIEETTQKNVIPEGALHKNKHHMEHAEGLTKKGIPVVDEDGEQQAEIEHSEIIFTLEVTKKLEEYYEIFYSEDSTNKEKEQAALDAGKLLVYQILENTEDRTGLIDSCKKGGSLTLKKSTDDLIEEVLEWMPTIIVVEEESKEEKHDKKEDKFEAKDELSDKDKMKEAIREVLIELLLK